MISILVSRLKNGLEGSRTPDLCNANAALYQTELQARMSWIIYHVSHIITQNPRDKEFKIIKVIRRPVRL